MVHRRGDSRLLSHLVSQEKEYAKQFQSLFNTSSQSLASLSAFAAASPPSLSQLILALTRTLAGADEALGRYASAVDDWRVQLTSLQELHDEVANVVRDRDILVSRLLKASKAHKPTRDSVVFPSSPSSSSLVLSSNSKLNAAQAELQACEAHLAEKEQELDVRRASVIRQGLALRCRAMVQCGLAWTELGRDALDVIGIPHPSSLTPSQSASQTNLAVLSPNDTTHIYSDVNYLDSSTNETSTSHPLNLDIPPAHAIPELTFPSASPGPGYSHIGTPQITNIHAIMNNYNPKLFPHPYRPDLLHTPTKRTSTLPTILQQQNNDSPHPSFSHSRSHSTSTSPPHTLEPPLTAPKPPPPPQPIHHPTSAPNSSPHTFSQSDTNHPHLAPDQHHQLINDRTHDQVPEGQNYDSSSEQDPSNLSSSESEDPANIQIIDNPRFAHPSAPSTSMYPQQTLSQPTSPRRKALFSLPFTHSYSRSPSQSQMPSPANQPSSASPSPHSVRTLTGGVVTAEPLTAEAPTETQPSGAERNRKLSFVRRKAKPKPKRIINVTGARTRAGGSLDLPLKSTVGRSSSDAGHGYGQGYGSGRGGGSLDIVPGSGAGPTAGPWMAYESPAGDNKGGRDVEARDKDEAVGEGRDPSGSSPRGGLFASWRLRGLFGGSPGKKNVQDRWATRTDGNLKALERERSQSRERRGVGNGGDRRRRQSLSSEGSMRGRVGGVCDPGTSFSPDQSEDRDHSRKYPSSVNLSSPTPTPERSRMRGKLRKSRKESKEKGPENKADKGKERAEGEGEEKEKGEEEGKGGINEGQAEGVSRGIGEGVLLSTSGDGPVEHDRLSPHLQNQVLGRHASLPTSACPSPLKIGSQAPDGSKPTEHIQQDNAGEGGPAIADHPNLTIAGVTDGMGIETGSDTPISVYTAADASNVDVDAKIETHSIADTGINTGKADGADPGTGVSATPTSTVRVLEPKSAPDVKRSATGTEAKPITEHEHDGVPSRITTANAGEHASHAHLAEELTLDQGEGSDARRGTGQEEPGVLGHESRSEVVEKGVEKGKDGNGGSDKGMTRDEVGRPTNHRRSSSLGPGVHVNPPAMSVHPIPPVPVLPLPIPPPPLLGIVSPNSGDERGRRVSLPAGHTGRGGSNMVGPSSTRSSSPVSAPAIKSVAAPSLSVNRGTLKKPTANLKTHAGATPSTSTTTKGQRHIRTRSVGPDTGDASFRNVSLMSVVEGVVRDREQGRLMGSAGASVKRGANAGVSDRDGAVNGAWVKRSGSIRSTSMGTLQGTGRRRASVDIADAGRCVQLELVQAPPSVGRAELEREVEGALKAVKMGSMKAGRGVGVVDAWGTGTGKDTVGNVGRALTHNTSASPMHISIPIPRAPGSVFGSPELAVDVEPHSRSPVPEPSPMRITPSRGTDESVNTLPPLPVTPTVPRVPGFAGTSLGGNVSANSSPSMSGISTLPGSSGTGRPARSPLRSALRNGGKVQPEPNVVLSVPLAPQLVVRDNTSMERGRPGSRAMAPAKDRPVQNGDANGDTEGQQAMDVVNTNINRDRSPASGDESSAGSVSSYVTGREVFIGSEDEDDTGQGADGQVGGLGAGAPGHSADPASKRPLKSQPPAASPVVSSPSTTSPHVNGHDRSLPPLPPSHGTVSPTRSPEDSPTPPSRRKSVRVSLQPMFSTTPPALDDDNVEDGLSGTGPVYVWYEPWSGGARKNRKPSGDGVKVPVTPRHGEGEGKGLIKKSGVARENGGWLETGGDVLDMWEDSSEDDYDMGYQQAKSLLVRSSGVDVLREGGRKGRP